MDSPVNEVQNKECSEKNNKVSTNRANTADRGLVTSAATMTTLVKQESRKSRVTYYYET
jgi:hypothetical protein